MLSNLSTARIQEFDNRGRLLNGGKITTYQLGTTIPKTSYIDINGQTANTNPIILDSNGSASIFLNGSYTLVLTDANDVLIDTVDIAGGISDYITSGGSGTFADNIVISVNNYDSVRALSNPYAFIFVQGREFQADGAEGIFFFDSSSSETDDDGATLSSSNSSGRYVRLNMSFIDPRWFGAAYNLSEEQGTFITKSETAALRYSLPIRINGSLYINQNYATEPLTEYIFTDDSKLVSTLGVTFTFSEGSKLLQCGRRVFGNTVQPKFETGTVDLIKYSWFDADNNEGRISKLLASSVAAFQLKFDEALSTAVAPQIPSNFELIPGEVVTITSQSDLSFSTNYTGYDQLFAYSNASNVGNVTVSGTTVRPEFFGIDNNISFKACAKTGKMLVSDKVYTITSAFCTNDLIIVGDPENSISTTAKIVLSASNSTPFISNVNMFLKNVNIESNANIETTVFSAEDSYISASTASISADFVNLESCTVNNENVIAIAPETDRYYTNVQFLDDQYKRRYQGFSSFRDVYLLNEISPFEQFVNFLSTDEFGKVYSTQTPNMDALSATHITVDRLDVRFNFETLIEFRWRNVLGTPYTEVFRNGVLLYDLPNPLTATYTATSADEKNIVVNITGSSIGTSQITLTSANSGISSRFHDVNILSMTTNSFLVGGDLIGGVFLLPNSFMTGKTGVNAQYYYTAKRWFLI